MKANIDTTIMKDDIQTIGLDIGRGYTKIYSVYNNVEYKEIFKSIYGLGTYIDTSKFNNPIYIERNEVEYFIGELAEKESDNATQGLKDDKCSQTVDMLVCASLSKVAQTERVNIMLGVPNKLFNKKTLDDIVRFYKNRVYNVKDKINNTYKKVIVNNINIFRESDAGLIWLTKDKETIDRPQCLVSLGFRTTEFTYFDETLRFISKKSKTKEMGNKTSLEYVQRKLSENNIMRELSEIDSSDKYDDLKKISYNLLNESLNTEIESTWINLKELDIYLAGGTVLNFSDIVDYKIVDDPQFATAKGLWYIGEEVL